jgi:Tol biopolymer transport system component
MGAGPTPTNHAWSPDGRNLTYQDESGRLWLTKSDGSEQKLLTDFPVSEVTWSPQDNLIAYISLRGDDVALETVNIASGEIRSLASADNYFESNPRWTPDGTSLFFVRHTIQGETPPVSAGIWHVPADGTAPPQRLTLTGDAIQVLAIR